jgi:hypothetical protein
MTLIRSNLTLANNLVVSNSSGLWRHPGSFFDPLLLNNCVNNSNNVNYLNLTPGTADFSADPRFVNGAAGDFHLLSASPCIDTGNNLQAPAFDYDGVGRPLDGGANGVAEVDIGAYEFVHPAADSDHDGMMDASEAIAGTNPADANSLLRLKLRLDPARSQAVLSWPSVTGRTYRVESQAVLAPTDSWEIISDQQPGVAGELEAVDPLQSTTHRFYRVGVSRE